MTFDIGAIFAISTGTICVGYLVWMEWKAIKAKRLAELAAELSRLHETAVNLRITGSKQAREAELEFRLTLNQLEKLA